MTIDKKDLQIRFLKEKNNYSSKITDEYVTFLNQQSNLNINFAFRIQFYNRISFQGFTISLKKIENKISPLILDVLKTYYQGEIGLSYVRFYKSDIDLSLYEINNEVDLDKFLNGVIKCLGFYEKEIFPQILNVRFLAKYLVSVPFERKAEVFVGGNFPVHLFKKMIILKWGNQQKRYEEYKKVTEVLIKEYALKKPEKYIPEMQDGFDKLIYQLENKPNPFENEMLVKESTGTINNKFLQTNNYIFFDGVKEKKVNRFYDDWLSSVEFSIYTKSFVKIDLDTIQLFQKKTNRIETLYINDKEFFNQLNNNLHFKIEKKDVDNYKIYDDKHKYDDYYYLYEEINNNKYMIFYSLGGSRFVESITLYKVFRKIEY